MTGNKFPTFLYLYAPEQYDFITGALKTYSVYEYSTPAFQGSFSLNLNNINDAQHSKQFINHLKQIEKLDGHFPSEIYRFIKNHRTLSDRVSDFAYKIKGVIADIKIAFTKKLISTSYSSLDKGKIVLATEKSRGVPPALLELIKLAQPKLYPLKSRDTASGSVSHEAVLSEIMETSDFAVASELNVWIKRGRKLITGHIDLVLVIGDAVFICDYKPLDTPFVTSRISDNFINVVPQVAVYSLMAKEQLNIKKVYSVIFNSQGVWIYEPKVILDKVNQFMHDQNVQDQITWDYYF